MSENSFHHALSIIVNRESSYRQASSFINHHQSSSIVNHCQSLIMSIFNRWQSYNGNHVNLRKSSIFVIHQSSPIVNYQWLSNANLQSPSIVDNECQSSTMVNQRQSSIVNDCHHFHLSIIVNHRQTSMIINFQSSLMMSIIANR